MNTDFFKTHPHILLFDGVCVLCNTSVQFMLKKDKKQKFRYAALQSEKAKEILRASNAPKNIPDSVIYIRRGKYYQKADAAIQISKTLGGVFKVLLIFKIFPLKLRDRIYEFIAQNRYRWFGKKDSCPMPSDSVKSLFLDM